MKKLFLIFILFSSFSFSNEKWELIWNDEFDGNELDQKKWSFWENNIPWNSGNYIDENNQFIDQYGFENQQYYLRENIKFDNSNLIITAERTEDKIIDGNKKILISSGAVHTKDKFDIKYGKIEIKASLPTQKGTWPAFWMWPSYYDMQYRIDNNGLWAKGEIDIMEFYGNNPSKIDGTIHVLDDTSNYVMFHKKYKLKKNENVSEFNIYSIIWDENKIEWYLNNKMYHKIEKKKVSKKVEYPFNENYFLMINLAIQKDSIQFEEEYPAEMKIDYVRIYKDKTLN